jgi:hypothetical protein
MISDTDSILIDRLLFAVEIEEGRDTSFVAANGMSYLTGLQVKSRGSRRYPNWTPKEDQFLRDHLGFITEEDIAAHLGRTVAGVHIRWKRGLHLHAPSRNPDEYTSQQAADLLGIDPHKIIHWCDIGMIPARRMKGKLNDKQRVIRLIKRVSFHRWVVSPSNWTYFDWKKIPDPHLRRLCELRSERWGDEWWTTVQVAQLHGVTTKDVQRLIYRGELPAVQVTTSIGGRHKDPAWLNWFVLKSDAPHVVFLRGRGSRNVVRFTPRAEAWMRKAHKLGWTTEAIMRSMGSKYRYDSIRKNVVRVTKKTKKA